VPVPELIGALLGYRAIYYIAPLIVAALLYLVMEVHARNLVRERTGSRSAGASSS
jgi:uncharacterized membrane protein YbhN (UPF0104 family)